MAELKEPRVPKPPKQGTAGRSSERAPLRGRNSQGTAGTSGVRKGIVGPGKGTSGKGIHKNPPRT